MMKGNSYTDRLEQATAKPGLGELMQHHDVSFAAVKTEQNILETIARVEENVLQV